MVFLVEQIIDGELDACSFDETESWMQFENATFLQDFGCWKKGYRAKLLAFCFQEREIREYNDHSVLIAKCELITQITAKSQNTVKS